MKNILSKFAGASLLAFALSLGSNIAVSAPITGTVSFNGGVTLVGAFPNPTGVSTWLQTSVFDGDGSFGILNYGDAAAFASNWTFVSGPVNAFWQAGGFMFDLTSSSISNFSATSIGITGFGILTGNGYDPTPGTWSFTTQAPGSQSGSFSFSASGAAVPDGGTTALLLGVSLVGMSFIVRRRKQVQA